MINRVEMTPTEVDGYKFACHMDSHSRGVSLPVAAIQFTSGMLDRRGISGNVEKVTVTFRHEGGPHLYELHYTPITPQ